MNSGLLSILAGELAKLFQPIRDAIENPRLLPRLLAEVGAEADTAGGDALVNALSAVATLADDVDQLASEVLTVLRGDRSRAGERRESLRCDPCAE